MGIFKWLPVNWHLAGPVGLFESVMVTIALGLNLRKIQRDKVVADWKYAQSLTERLEISERAARLAEEKAFAMETVHSQNAPRSEENTSELQSIMRHSYYGLSLQKTTHK